MHILSPETDNCPSWISGRERMTVENISWSISTKECCRPRRGLNPRPPGLQSDGASNWATEAPKVFVHAWWHQLVPKYLYMHGDINLSQSICWHFLVLCKVIEDILNMCLKKFDTGKKNKQKKKKTFLTTDSHFNLEMYVHPYVYLSVGLYCFPQSHNLKQIYILLHCFSVPRT